MQSEKIADERVASAGDQASGAAHLERVAIATHGLWVLAAVFELFLVTRVVVMAIVGAPITGIGLGATAGRWLYHVTGVAVTPLESTAQTPLTGSHLVDVAALLAIEIVFFSVLAITKTALWLARRLALKPGAE